MGVESVFVAPAGGRDPEVAALVARALDAGARVFELAPGGARPGRRHRHPAPGARGVADDRRRAPGPRRPGPLVVVCVDVRDPGNAGTVLRSADAAGATAVSVRHGTVDPFNPKTVRSSAGSIFHVPLAVVPDHRCSSGWEPSRPTGTSARSPTVADYTSVDSPIRAPSCSGTRRPGCRRRCAARSTARWRIPMAGRAESLNVGRGLRGAVLRGPAPAARGEPYDATRCLGAAAR